MRSALGSLLLLLCACSGPGPGCADCCPPGDPGSAPVTIGCTLLRPDGGPAAGVRAACSSVDAGGVSGSTGSVSFQTTMTTCGIAAGSVLCGEVVYSEGGSARVADAGTGSFEVPASCSRTLF